MLSLLTSLYHCIIHHKDDDNNENEDKENNGFYKLHISNALLYAQFVRFEECNHECHTARLVMTNLKADSSIIVWRNGQNYTLLLTHNTHNVTQFH